MNPIPKTPEQKQELMRQLRELVNKITSSRKNDDFVIDVTHLTEKIKTKVDFIEVENSNSYYTNDNFYDEEEELYNYNSWKLGTQYKQKLNLNQEDVKLLNKISLTTNSFLDMEFCRLEVLKLYLAVISELKKQYTQEKTTLENQFLSIADIVARKQYRYRNGSKNYRYCIKVTTNDFHSIIFKHCENAVRECYAYKRKVNIFDAYINQVVKIDYETKILSKVLETLPVLSSKIKPLDEATDIELYLQNTSRWKIKFEELTTHYQNNSQAFLSSILALGKKNKKNPYLDTIFFESAKFMAKHDKETTLSLYIYYVYFNCKTKRTEKKQLSKAIQKSLFQTKEQVQDFECIVKELLVDKNLEKALRNIPSIYEVKRKKIILDTSSIKEVIEQHSETVELLNEYLQDDDELDSRPIKVPETTVKVQVSTTNSAVPLTPIQTLVLELFEENNFSVSQSQLENFAKSNGVFKNSLIESINDTCFELFDDVLIEEEDEFYTLNTNYFNSLIAK